MRLSAAIPPLRDPHVDDAVSALARVSPQAADAAGHVLSVLLDGAVPASNARWGRLNRNGGPIELAWSSACPDLRYVVDIGGAPGSRLTRTRLRLARLDRKAVFALPPEMPVRARPTWGAWLGVRHGADAVPRFKLYVELDGTIPTPEGEALRWDAEPLAPTLAGLTDRHGSEYYYELPGHGLPLSRLTALLAPFGLADRTDELVGLIRRFEFRRAAAALPGIRFGLSVVPGPASAITLFVHAGDVAGDDADLRRMLLRCADAIGLNMDRYAALSAPFADGTQVAGHHNMLGFHLAVGRPAGVQVSFRPPVQR